MKKNHRFWLLALALSLLLTCAACGKQKTPAADTTPDTKQEQTTDTRKDDTAETGTTKADGKQDAAKTEDKTADDKKSDEQKPTGEAKKTEEDTKKQEEEKKQEEPKQEIDPDTGKDKYETDPVPEGKPAPVEPEDTAEDTTVTHTCTFSISCATILSNMDKCDKSKQFLVPSDGVILPSTTVTFSEGESVYDVLQRLCRENGIHMESSWTPIYNSAYVEGINNLYEFDVGKLSGWMYSVNSWFPNYGCSRYALQNGDVVNWVYTCDLGKDVGGGYSTGS